MNIKVEQIDVRAQNPQKPDGVHCINLCISKQVEDLLSPQYVVEMLEGTRKQVSEDFAVLHFHLPTKIAAKEFVKFLSETAEKNLHGATMVKLPNSTPPPPPERAESSTQLNMKTNNIKVSIEGNYNTGDAIAKMDLILTPVCEEVFKTIFEVEMIQGEREQLADGRAHWILSDVDPAKARLFMDHMQQAVEKTNQPTQPKGPALNN